MTVFIKFYHHPGIENEPNGPGNKKETATNIDNRITNEDDDIINSDAGEPVNDNAEEVTAGIDKKELVETDASPTEEDMDEADNNYRDALNDDSLEAPEKKR